MIKNFVFNINDINKRKSNRPRHDYDHYISDPALFCFLFHAITYTNAMPVDLISNMQDVRYSPVKGFVEFTYL